MARGASSEGATKLSDSELRDIEAFVRMQGIAATVYDPCMMYSSDKKLLVIFRRNLWKTQQGSRINRQHSQSASKDASNQVVANA